MRFIPILIFFYKRWKKLYLLILNDSERVPIFLAQGSSEMENYCFVPFFYFDFICAFYAIYIYNLYVQTGWFAVALFILHPMPSKPIVSLIQF